MAKKQNRYHRLAAKRLGTTKSGCPINLPNRQVLRDNPLNFRFKVDGQLVWKTFPPTADGWRNALELARGDAQFMDDMSSIESAKACGFSGWLLQLAIEKGVIPDPSHDQQMAGNTPSL